MDANISTLLKREPGTRRRGFLRQRAFLKAAGLAERLKQNGRRAEGEEGLALVEFALSCSILCLILFGTFQVSLLVYTYDFVCEAARDGARYAIVRGTKCTAMPDCGATSAQIQTHVQAQNYPGITTSNLTASAVWYKAATAPPNMVWSSCTGTCNVEGNAVQVTVNYPYTFSVPFWNTVTVNLTNSSQMVISQ